MKHATREAVFESNLIVATFARTWGFRWCAHVLANVATVPKQSLTTCALTALLSLAVAWSDALAADGALVIGVNDCPKYRLPNGSRPRPLKGAEADADAMAACLIERFGFARDKVRVLKGEQASRQRVGEALQQLQKTLKAGDRYMLHFSGHGTQVSDQKPFDEQDDGLDEALCLSDSDEQGNNLLLDDELGRWLDDLPEVEVTVILDCCHAGTGVKDADDDVQARFLPTTALRPVRGEPNPPWKDLRPSTKGTGCRLTAIYACQPHEQSYERRFGDGDQARRAGQFTHFLLDAITNRQAGDGRITNEEALRFATERLDTNFNRQRPERAAQQHPQLETAIERRPLFGAKPQR